MCAHLFPLLLATRSASSLAFLMRFEAVDVFVEDHGRRLDFFAPALLFAPSGGKFFLDLRLIISRGNQFR